MKNFINLKDIPAKEYSARGISKDDIRSILKSKGYNPLKYLEDAKERNIDLTEFF